METALKIVLGGTLLSGAYFMLKGKEGETVGVGTLAFKVAGDQCYAEVVIKNTGGIAFAPKVSFTIKPAGFTTDIPAVPKDGASFLPGATQTVTTNSVTLPSTTTAGAVWARIQIGRPDGVAIPGAVVEVAEAYTVPSYGAQIISYTFH